jgi:hypothetical protein
MTEGDDFSLLVAKAAECRAKADAVDDNSSLKAALEAVTREYKRLARLQKPKPPPMAGIE